MLIMNSHYVITLDKTNFTHKRHFKTSFSVFWNKSHLCNFWKIKLNYFNSNLIINSEKLMSIHIPDLCGKYKKCQNIDLEIYIIIQTIKIFQQRVIQKVCSIISLPLSLPVHSFPLFTLQCSSLLSCLKLS